LGIGIQATAKEDVKDFFSRVKRKMTRRKQKQLQEPQEGMPLPVGHEHRLSFATQRNRDRLVAGNPDDAQSDANPDSGPR
jgi:hypothetical protein